MRKRAALAVLIIICAALMGGCWNYRSMNDMTITTGVAVDRDPETGLYHLSFEYVDLSGPVKEQGIAAGLLETYGVTMFDAARNAKKRVTNKVYLGHIELVVLDEEVARESDIVTTMDFFLRDAECRETVCVAVSQMETAKELLRLEGVGQPMVAYEIHNIIEEDRRVTASTIYNPVYKIYNIIYSEGIELTLPAVRSVPNDGTITCEVNGIAVFKNGRLVGYLSPEESKYFLFVMGEVEGGVITCSASGEGPEDTALEIHRSNTKRSFRWRDGQLSVQVEVEVVVYLDETAALIDLMEPSVIQQVEASGAQKLARGIADMIQRVRTEYRSDIFGFGNMICKQDHKLWEQLKDNWDEVFVNMPVEITCKVDIVNTAYLKKT